MGKTVLILKHPHGSEQEDPNFADNILKGFIIF